MSARPRLHLAVDETVKGTRLTELQTEARRHGHRLRRTSGRRLRNNEAAVTEDPSRWNFGLRNVDRVLTPPDALELFVNLSLRIPCMRPGVKAVAGGALGSDGAPEVTDELEATYDDVTQWRRKAALRRLVAFAIQDPPANFQVFGAMAITSPRPAINALKLCTLITRPDCRGNGYGATLLEQTLDLAQINGIPVVYTTVAEGNGEMRAFLALKGFTEQGRKAQTGELVMQTSLAAERSPPAAARRPYAWPELKSLVTGRSGDYSHPSG